MKVVEKKNTIVKSISSTVAVGHVAPLQRCTLVQLAGRRGNMTFILRLFQLNQPRA